MVRWRPNKRSAGTETQRHSHCCPPSPGPQRSAGASLLAAVPDVHPYLCTVLMQHVRWVNVRVGGCGREGNDEVVGQYQLGDQEANQCMARNSTRSLVLRTPAQGLHVCKAHLTAYAYGMRSCLVIETELKFGGRRAWRTTTACT